MLPMTHVVCYGLLIVQQVLLRLPDVEKDVVVHIEPILEWILLN